MTDQYSLHLQGHIHIYPMNYNLFCIDMQLEKYSTQSMLEILIASHLHSLVPDNRTCLLIDRLELVGLRNKQKQPSNIGGLIFLSSPCQIQTWEYDRLVSCDNLYILSSDNTFKCHRSRKLCNCLLLCISTHSSGKCHISTHSESRTYCAVDPSHLYSLVNWRRWSPTC